MRLAGARFAINLVDQAGGEATARTLFVQQLYNRPPTDPQPSPQIQMRCIQRQPVVSAVPRYQYIPLHLLEHLRLHALQWLLPPPSLACMPSFRQDLWDENDTRATINKAVEEVVVGDLVEGVAEVEVVVGAVVAADAVEITSEGVRTESIGRQKVETPPCHR